MILVIVKRKGKSSRLMLAHYNRILFPFFGEENPQTFSIAFSSKLQVLSSYLLAFP
jgi:hypothetical protein